MACCLCQIQTGAGCVRYELKGTHDAAEIQGNRDQKRAQRFSADYLAVACMG